MRYSMKIAAMFALSAPLSLAGCMAASGDDEMDESLGEADGALDEKGHGSAPVSQVPVYHAPNIPAPSYPAPHFGAPRYTPPIYRAPQYQQPTYHQPEPQPGDLPGDSSAAEVLGHTAPVYKAPTYPGPTFQGPVYQAPIYLPPIYQGGGYPMPGYYGQYGQYGGMEPGYPRPPVTVVVVVNQ